MEVGEDSAVVCRVSGTVSTNGHPLAAQMKAKLPEGIVFLVRKLAVPHIAVSKGGK